ncbi:MAG TPA: hypothetical protein VM581_00120, partial [Magnetospirillaceae bacterium]|nr:hypothetical protein [Magnetospirillaceae bacterium]
MCNTWPLPGADEAALAIEGDNAQEIAQITWERLPGLLEELLARFCSKVELVSTSNNGIKLGVMKLDLKHGVTRITILNWILERLRLPAVWSER